jgi:2-amino-4-hydroxy-6-hydroxymethyldihydropteridine diphosphokinase
MPTIYLALGTNLGDRLANLRAAIAALPPAVRVARESPVYETPPWGIADQPAFLNMVLEAETDRAPLALLEYLKGLETRLGRQPGLRYGPRLIDLDILFYDDLVLDTPPLVIPHPRLHERAFVLVPLAYLAPDLRHPPGGTVRELLAKVDTAGIRLYNLDRQGGAKS